MSDFPILDSPRTEATAELSRTVIDDDLGCIEPLIDETDNWCTMPLRVAWSEAAALYLEVGPYDLGRTDVDRLREAIRRFDLASQGGVDGRGLRAVK